MSEFRVWAPAAKTVEVQCGAGRIAMARESGGWWRAEAAGASHGTDYAFIVDGGKPLPDPRSRWQPHGVHGASRIVDHAGFKWTDDRWNAPPLGSAIIYEAHVGTFSPEGTFDAAIERLDYLTGLGITHLELMPVAEFAGDRGWGYDGVDLFAPHHAYGGPDGLKRLVDACHARGLAVILDVVYNHFGPSGNYLSQFGPYLTDRYKTPWGDAVNLDGRGSDEVRRYFCDNALAWLRDYHLDALRIDAVHAIVDTSAVHILEQMAREVGELSLELGRRLVLIAESDLNDPRLVRPAEIGGYGLDAMWCDDFHHAVHTVLTGERSGYYIDFGRVADLAKALEAGFVYDGRYSEFRGRSHGRPPTGVQASSFVAFVQNHDQVGNRAVGERLSHLVGAGRVKIAAAIVMIAPMAPLIFQGEEWSASTPFQYFAGHEEPELARAVSEGRRREFEAFGWRHDDVPDPEARETFQRAKLRWDELDAPSHREMLAWYRALIQMRKAIATLRDGRFDRVEVSFDESARWLVVRRGEIMLAANFGSSPCELPLPDGDSWAILLASEPEIRIEANRISLARDSVAILATSAASRIFAA
jgi:maltooligosyltrehalose trehalohydrolase